MKPYTYFRAVEKAYTFAEIYNSEYFWSKHERLRDGLIKRLIRIEQENKELKIKLDYYENHLEAYEINMWGMP